jgi:hypothetical protein
LGLALVKDLRDFRAPLGEEEIEEFETDVLAMSPARCRVASRSAHRPVHPVTAHVALRGTSGRSWGASVRDR